jgi:hypothetical protein
VRSWYGSYTSVTGLAPAAARFSASLSTVHLQARFSIGQQALEEVPFTVVASPHLSMYIIVDVNGIQISIIITAGAPLIHTQDAQAAHLQVEVLADPLLSPHSVRVA